MRIDRLGLSQLVELAKDIEDFEEAIAAAARALPADPSAILDFFEIPSGDAFDVKPEQAISFFKAKKLKPTFSYADMMDQAHDHAFTVAKMMDVDMLGQIRASLDSAMANGQPFKEWADSITPVLQSGGWWGRKEVLDPLTGQPMIAQLGSPWRLETIFRTNMQSAYAAGAWQEIKAQADIAPFLMYDSIDDFRTRPLHAAWDRTILPVTDAWWGTHYPPNGYNCRCGVIQLSRDDLNALGLEPNVNPQNEGNYDWTNPRTGEELTIPKGIDPGFSHNSGDSWAWKSKQLLKEKIDALPAEMAAAAKKAAADATKISQDAIAAAQAAQLELAAAQTKAALARAKALADEKAAQWAAAQQVEAIAKGNADAIGKGAAYKVKALQQLKKGDDWATLKPTEQLQAIDKLAGEFKLKTETASKLSVYKKAILEGKTPPPNTVKAFQSLPEADQNALLAKIDAEKAAIEAKKAAEAAAAAKKAAGATPSAGAMAPEPAPPNPDTMVMIGRKTKGGTEGAFYQDTATGQKYLVKFNGSEDAVLNEVLAGSLYNLAGVEAPELHAITLGGRPALASRIVDGIAEVDAATLARTASVQEGFAVDAWLANWDSVGLNYDNTVLIGGRALRIDVGGSLRYRALGGLKGNAFGRTVGEIDSLRDGTNPQAKAVFGNITQDQIEAGVVKVLRVSDADIRAMVGRHGPRDATERRLLADTLIARKADLAKRYPKAAERARMEAQAADATQAPPPRVTAQEQQFIDDSRVNGYGLATDKDQIEDHMVIVSRYTTAKGEQATRGFLKLRPDAGAKIAATGPGGQSVDLDEARRKILESVKSINYRAAQGKELDQSKRDDLGNNVALLRRKSAELRSAAAKASNPKPLLNAADEIDGWAVKIETVLTSTPAGAVPANVGMFSDASIPSSLSWTAPQQAAAQGIQWRKVTGSYSFNTATFDRSFAKETTRTQEVYGVRVRYEADLPDGTRVVFLPHDPGVPFAMQGVMRIDVPGGGPDATERVLGVLGEAGIYNERADQLARKHLYVNSLARLRLTSAQSTPALRGKFAAMGSDEQGLQDKLALLRTATGVDIEKSDGWAAIDGVRQAFGHGRAYQLRPDLSAADLQAFGRTHVLYHNPQGLSRDAGSRVFDKLKPVIDGGGVLASLVDRMRRGVAFSGSSVESDLDTGGGDFTFTRIRERSDQKGTGVYWRVSQLRRMDAITYDSDQFGRTTGDHIENNRRGQTIEDMKRVSNGRSNETIFKGGLSLFDEIDRIVLDDAAEVKDAIDWMKSKGYRTWPDGRKLEDVIITRAKHHANP
jgi:SPP1 gp7 family putative phage head morphogenesis protein